jgi:hypothetical protein
MRFLITCLCFVATLFIQYLIDTFLFPLGKIGSTLLVIVGLFILPKHLSRTWSLRQSGKPMKICRFLYSEALAFLGSHGYPIEQTEITYSWMCLYLYLEPALELKNKSLPSQVLQCYQYLIQSELSPQMPKGNIPSHVFRAYDYCKEHYTTQVSILADDLQIVPHSLIAVKMISLDDSPAQIARNFSPHFYAVDKKFYALFHPSK